MLAVPDSLLTVAGLVVVVIILALLVMSLRPGGPARGGRSFDVSPPQSGQPDDRKPHD